MLSIVHIWHNAGFSKFHQFAKQNMEKDKTSKLPNFSNNDSIKQTSEKNGVLQFYSSEVHSTNASLGKNSLPDGVYSLQRSFF